MRSLIAAALVFAVFAGPSAAQPADWNSAQNLTVELSSFKFSPAALSLQHGTPYRLHFVNRAGGAHDFVAKEFFASSTIAPEDRGKLSGGGLDLDGGESADIRLIPNRTGTYKSHCSHFMHSMFGMTGTVTVR